MHTQIPLSPTGFALLAFSACPFAPFQTSHEYMNQVIQDFGLSLPNSKVKVIVFLAKILISIFDLVVVTG